MANFNQCIQIANQYIGDTYPAMIVAEAGVNHNGSMDIARQLIDVACEAGADAVKFQSFKSASLILENVEKAPYQVKGTNKVESQIEMLRKLELSYEQACELKAYCDDKGIIYLTTPFDEYSLEDVIKMDIAAIKVASTDLTNLPLLRKIGSCGVPVLLSTGMSYMSEVEMAVNEIAKNNVNLVLMQCTANYPPIDSEMNLLVIRRYRDSFGCLTGFSDHSEGIGAAPYSVPLGAKVIEKHFTLDKTLQGPDHAASLSPPELKEFIATIRQVERFLGDSVKRPTLAEVKTRASLQKCLVAKTAIQKGELFNTENMIAKRTGGEGVSPIYFDELVGQVAPKSFHKDDIIEI